MVYQHLGDLRAKVGFVRSVVEERVVVIREILGEMKKGPELPLTVGDDEPAFGVPGMVADAGIERARRIQHARPPRDDVAVPSTHHRRDLPGGRVIQDDVVRLHRLVALWIRFAPGVSMGADRSGEAVDERADVPALVGLGAQADVRVSVLADWRPVEVCDEDIPRDTRTRTNHHRGRRGVSRVPLYCPRAGRWGQSLCEILGIDDCVYLTCGRCVNSLLKYMSGDVK